MSFENTFDKLNDEFPVDLSEKVSELQAEIESLRAKLESKDLALVPRTPTPDMRDAFHLSMELYENCESDLGLPDDQWVAMINAFETLEQGK